MSALLHDLQIRKNIGKAKALLHSLVPRAQCFCFYDADRLCVWSSDGADDYEVDGFVADMPGEQLCGDPVQPAGLRRTLTSGRTVLGLPVADDEGSLLGLLVAVFSRNAGQASSFNPTLIAGVLAPAVGVIGESLLLGQRIDELYRRATEAEEELGLVYQVDEKIHNMSRSHAGLAQLVGQSGRYLSIAYNVLLMPSKRIRVSATHSSWRHVNRKMLDRYLVDHLMPKLEGQRQPRVFEIPATEHPQSAIDQGYQALLCPLMDRHGNLQGVLAQLGRVNGEKFSAAERRFMAHIVRKVEYVVDRSFDAMTGIMNRSGFEAQLYESAKALGDGRDAHQLIYFDLDNLQLVNDTFGRKAGDEVIIRFARLLEEDLPRNAVVSRLTGDEFCILVTHAGKEAALDLARSIREKGESLRYLEGDKSLQITMSVGIAEFSEQPGDHGSALSSARLACKAAKDHGRDRIEVYDDHNLSIIQRHDDIQLVSQIQQVLDADGFELLAQPISSLRGDDAQPRFEVLLRMPAANGNEITSRALFSAAERYQLMPQIDRWVVSATIGRLAAHAEALAARNASFSINLSGQSLGDDGILEFIREELRHTGLAPRNLCFEITESAAVSNLHKAQAFIDALHDSGCRISLDDFGAGLSSFAYLKNFHVDTLKIDGSFIRDITGNRISESMVAAITQVAKVMGLETVAEYVETAKARKLVAELGVDFAQGHAVGRPLPLDEVLRALLPARDSSSA